MKKMMFLVVLSSCFVYPFESHKKASRVQVTQKEHSNHVSAYYHNWPGSSSKSLSDTTTESQSQQTDEKFSDKISFEKLVPSQLTTYIKICYDYAQKTKS